MKKELSKKIFSIKKHSAKTAQKTKNIFYEKKI